MVIKASSEKTVDRLIADLSSSDAIARDAAIARLTVIGARAVHRLLGVAADAHADASSRSAAFRTLEAIADPRTLDAALDGLASGEETVAAAAAGVARVLLKTPKGDTALDRLTTVALDRQRPTAVRLAAIGALSDLDPATMKPVLAELSQDPDEAVAAAVRRPGHPPTSRTNPLALLEETAEGGRTTDPAEVRGAVAQCGAKAPLALLHQLIQRAREREGEGQGEVRHGWLAVRATTHAALAQRGSRLALYDLRDTIEAAKTPLPVEFVAALTSLGDVSCLDAVASAYARAAVGAPLREDWWRRSLADVFRTIVARDGVTRRHAAAKRIERRWPGLFQSLVERR